MCMEGKGHYIILGGDSRDSLSEEVTLAGSFKRKMKHMPPLLATYTGEPMYQHLFHGIIIQYFTHVVELGSLLFHFSDFSP